MFNIDAIIILGYVLTAIVLGIFITFSILEFITRIREFKLMKKESEFQMDLDIINSDIDKSSFEILDKIIDETFNEYILMNYGFNNNTITSKEEEMILREVCTTVGIRISPILRKKIYCIYNEVVFEDILVKKINILITSFAFERNKTKPDKR